MKICLLSKGPNTHTEKWVEYLIGHKNEVYVLSFLPAKIEGARVINLKPPALPLKVGYVFVKNKVKKILEGIKPDILHAHYASSYGFLGALADFHPFVVSVWGSDVFDFPKKSPLHSAILRYSLSKADAITSTSEFMRDETNKYAQYSPVGVIPFGVDTNLFKPGLKQEDGVFTIGSARSLDDKYGLEYLIKSYKNFAANREDSRLVLVGRGPLEKKLKKMTIDLGINDKVEFTGFLPQTNLAELMQSWDVGVLPSVKDSESFGVFALEASATGIPVIASNVGGLNETVLAEETGLFCEPKNVDDLTRKLIRIYDDRVLRKNLGMQGRKFVESHFDWNKTSEKMLALYKKVLIK